MGWRGGYPLIEGLPQQRVGLGLVSFTFPLRYNSHRMHHSKCKVQVLLTYVTTCGHHPGQAVEHS